MASIGKALKNFYALINFFEERKYSVEKLKNVVTTSCKHAFECDEIQNWTGWNSSEVVDVPWSDGNVYPAYFLQFGGKVYIFFIFILIHFSTISKFHDFATFCPLLNLASNLSTEI